MNSGAFFSRRWRRIAWLVGIVFALALAPITAGMILIVIGGSQVDDGGNFPVSGLIFLGVFFELIVPAFFASITATIIEVRLRHRPQPRGPLWWTVTIGLALLPIAAVAGWIAFAMAHEKQEFGASLPPERKFASADHVRSPSFSHSDSSSALSAS
jgi:hypothetical protein